LIAFAIYLLIFLLLIYVNGFFKLFSDETLSKKTFSVAFLLKALAVPVFYFLYVKMYGGIDDFDAGKFYHDAKIMNDLAYKNFPEYLKMLFGLQDDLPGSYFYNTSIETTYNWDNGKLKDFFYNDNRVVIRIHSVLHFIAFNSYFVHALFSCFFSFIGFTFIYKALKQFFRGIEFWLFVIICLFPSLWLFTGALLKEGLTILFLGCILLQIKNISENGLKISSTISMVALVFISLLLKPYLLFYSVIYFGLFFTIKKYYRRKNKSLVFFGSLIVMVVLINLVSIFIKRTSLPEAALQREREFADLSKGGIFLQDSVKFVRLKYDYNLVKKVEPQQVKKAEADKKYFIIKKNVPFTYWEHSHQQDTLFCKFNSDTLTQYSFVYDLPTAGSNFDIGQTQQNIFITSLKGLYYPLVYPFFYNARGPLKILASFENLALIVSILFTLIMAIVERKQNFPALVFLIFGLSLFILIGVTTPNSGAVMRYRAPVAVFVIISALYYVNVLKNKKT